MIDDILPENIGLLIKKYVNLDKLNEIRIRQDKPIILNIANSIWGINNNGLCHVKDGLISSKEMIEKILSLASENSIYSFENQLKFCYITAACGIRIGVAGDFVEKEEKISGLKNICSLNIRIPHCILGCSNKIMHYIINDNFVVNNTLVLSPPGVGKTTMLRDIINNFSHLNRYINCLVIDERYEIVGRNGIKNYYDLGNNIDVLYGGCKSYSINCGIRSLSPNIVFTDEIATLEDAKSILYAKNCGVNVIATIHAKNLKDFSCKYDLSELFLKKVFDRFIVLSNRKGYGTIEGVYDSNYKMLYGE